MIKKEIEEVVDDIYEEYNKEPERKMTIWMAEGSMKAFDDAIKEQAKKWRTLNV